MSTMPTPASRTPKTIRGPDVSRKLSTMATGSVKSVKSAAGDPCPLRG